MSHIPGVNPVDDVDSYDREHVSCLFLKKGTTFAEGF